MGVTLGPEGIPSGWIEGICDWPRSVKLLTQVSERLARQKASGRTLGPVRYFWPGLRLRNAVFLLAVLMHGLRRLAPPY